MIARPLGQITWAIMGHEPIYSIQQEKVKLTQKKRVRGFFHIMVYFKNLSPTFIKMQQPRDQKFYAVVVRVRVGFIFYGIYFSCGMIN